MHWIEKIRAKLGWSQAELAMYLGLSRSSIAMAERDRLTLGAQPLLHLHRLDTWCELPLEPAVRDIAAEQEALPAADAEQRFSQRLTLCESLLAKALEDIERADERTGQALRALQCLTQMQTRATTPPIVYQTLEEQALKTLQQYGRPYRREKQHQVLMLRAEIAAIQAFLAP